MGRSNMHLATRTVRLAAVGVCAWLCAGCGDDFDPRTLLDGYRVVGIEADAPEVGPDDTVQLTVHDFNDEAQPAAYAWTLCVYTFGPQVDFECADSALEFEVGDAPVITVDLSEDGVGLRSLYETYGPYPGNDGEDRTLEDGFDIYLVLESGPTCEGCRQIRTVKRLFVREADDVEPNVNPTIDAFEIDGEPRAGGSLTLRVDPGPVQTYDSELTGETREEELLFTWYTSAGETDPGLTFGTDAESTLKLPDEPGPLEVVVAVRDGRGGLAVERRTIDVAP